MKQVFPSLPRAVDYLHPMMRKLSLVFISSFCVSVASAQLSGTYQVGPGGDFADLTSAMSSAMTEGLVDSTLFIVAPGGEPISPLTIGEIPGISATHLFHVLSSSPDSSLIDIGPVTFDHASYVMVEGFTMSNPIDPPNSTQAAVYLNQCIGVTLRRCHILEVGDPGYSYANGLLKIYLANGSTTYTGTVVRIQDCSAASMSTVLCIFGNFGTVAFANCVLTGGLDCTNYHRTFDGCSITTASADYPGNDHFRHCQFSSPTGQLALKGSLVQDCIFSCNVDLTISDAVGNSFQNVDMLYATDSHLVGNDIDTLYMDFSHYSKLIGNRLHGPVHTNSQGVQYYSNSFDKGLLITHGPDQVIQQNTFGPGASFEADYCAGVTRYNSFWNIPEIGDPEGMNLLGNNYASMAAPVPYFASFDPKATYYDPEYIDTAGYWRATNVQLSGKCDYVGTNTMYDIDSILRDEPTDVGANVICITPSAMPDTLRVQCGDLIAPRLCLGQSGYQLSPVPLGGAITAGNWPLQEGAYLFLLDSTGSRHDSCWIVGMHYPQPTDIQLYAYCGYPVWLTAAFPSFADSMLWTPSELFLDPTVPSNMVQSDSSIWLTSTVYSSLCGTIQQAFHLNISSAPVAYFNYDQETNIVQFNSHADCCDSIQWNFGDSTFSTAPNPEHTYTYNQGFIVSFTCWQQGDSGVSFMYVDVDGLGIHEEGTSPVHVYPNPSSGLYHLSGSLIERSTMDFDVFDMLGRSMKQGSVSLPGTIDLSNMDPGQYVLDLILDHRKIHMILIKE